MKALAIIMWAAIILLMSSFLSPTFLAAIPLMIFFGIFEYARKKKMMLLAIIFFILATLTVPVFLIIEYVFFNK